MRCKYDTRKMGIMKVAVCVRFFIAPPLTLTGRVTNQRRGEITALWLPPDQFVVPVSQRPAVLEEAKKHSAAGDDSDDELEKDEDVDDDVAQQERWRTKMHKAFTERFHKLEARFEARGSPWGRKPRPRPGRRRRRWGRRAARPR